MDLMRNLVFAKRMALNAGRQWSVGSRANAGGESCESAEICVGPDDIRSLQDQSGAGWRCEAVRSGAQWIIGPCRLMWTL
jgi:hypothetical protein